MAIFSFSALLPFKGASYHTVSAQQILGSSELFLRVDTTRFGLLFFCFFFFQKLKWHIFVVTVVVVIFQVAFKRFLLKACFLVL